MSRRLFLRLGLYGSPFLVAGHALAIEPNWLKVRRMRLCEGEPSCRFVHFTDLHYKGDREGTLELVRKINAQKPDFVCFTGDLVEEAEPLGAALEILQGINAPLYGVPGNHDYWSGADFKSIAKAFAKTGGAWLEDEAVVPKLGGGINLIGLTCTHGVPAGLATRGRNLVLIHYPDFVDRLAGVRAELVLAGHTHGGQVRVPFFGPLILPREGKHYDLGLFQTRAGPLYVSSGVGWFYLNLRFNCRPEIVVFEI